MPWKECHVMDERLRFVARLLDGEKMAPLCERHAHWIRQRPTVLMGDFNCSGQWGKSWSRRHATRARPSCAILAAPWFDDNLRVMFGRFEFRKSPGYT